MFTKHVDNEKQKSILIVYVNDIIVIGDNLHEIEELKKCLKVEFEVKNIGILQFFLGRKVTKGRRGIFISQRKYTLNLLKEI
uniref:Reverse transcriptase Ty1/copia-type domain-containing protein n=1 Tax=Rhizophora mucronata TaxID=61149 RepID=A0A2P2NYL3_RHIMU